MMNTNAVACPMAELSLANALRMIVSASN